MPRSPAPSLPRRAYPADYAASCPVRERPKVRPAAGTAEVIVDITTTGATLPDNDASRSLEDGSDPQKSGAARRFADRRLERRRQKSVRGAADEAEGRGRYVPRWRLRIPFPRRLCRVADVGVGNVFPSSAHRGFDPRAPRRVVAEDRLFPYARLQLRGVESAEGRAGKSIRLPAPHRGRRDQPDIRPVRVVGVVPRAWREQKRACPAAESERRPRPPRGSARACARAPPGSFPAPTREAPVGEAKAQVDAPGPSHPESCRRWRWPPHAQWPRA